jgi:hypothetical protein
MVLLRSFLSDSRKLWPFRVAGAATAIFMTCPAWAAVPATAPSTQHQINSTDIAIMSMPENGSDGGLTIATWALAILTGGLCGVTWVSAKFALADAKRLRRDVQERELNSAAHKAAAMAEHVGQLAARVPRANTHLRSFPHEPVVDAADASILSAATDRALRTNEIKDYALANVSQVRGDRTDSDLAAIQRRLDEHLVQLEVMKEAITGELEALARQVDASERQAAAMREEERLARLRTSSEVGQCNKLIFILGQMVSSLEDVKQSLFDDPRKQLGHEPQWNEIGALVGAPAEGPEFDIGEYAFLLENEDPADQMPNVLASIYTAAANFRQVLARANERSRLWHDFNELRAATRFSRGEASTGSIGSSEAISARLKEHTRWLEDDLKQWIPGFKALFPKVYQVLNTTYPGRRFIRFWPISDPKAPSL